MLKRCMPYWIFILFMFDPWQKTQAEMFTALAEMEPLLETEGILLDSFNTYIKHQEHRLNILKIKYKEFQSEHNYALDDVSGYLSNPVNAFKIIKRLTTDWGHVENLIVDDNGKEVVQNITSIKEKAKFPTDEDLSGAVTALIRLQDTYKLDTAEVARGRLNGIKYSADMTAHDCFELGRHTYNAGDYDHTEKWMSVALNKVNGESNKTAHKTDILEYLAFSTYMIGNVDTAIKLTNELLEIMPDHSRARGNIPHYEKALLEIAQQNNDNSIKVETPETKWSIERNVYEELCRNELDLAESVKKDLKCRYFSDTHPFLKLAPFKVEERYLDPYIVVYHDVLSDREIDFIKGTAKPRFKRATVQDALTGELITAKYRISKSAWLKDEEDRIIAKISRRVMDMTGLSMDTAEELQVVNYGIGGHYEPHFDFARKSEIKAFGGPEGNGNRIATVLFYMSDVEQGGGTVFPELGLSLTPKKGTGAFWFNLFPSGDGNYATRHAACPVLQGSKWVSNKWIHQSGQELLKPCNLEYQQEGMNDVYPPPVRKAMTS